MSNSDRLRSGIFISYRRKDASGHAIALTDRLRERFSHTRIFKDTDSLLPGEDFVAAIQRELESCAILLVVIGRDWLSIQDDRRKTRRLDDPKDYLRLEVATALKNEHVLVIPVLVEGVSMPIADDLPPDLELLSRRTAAELSDSRWDADVKQLIKTIESALGHIAEETGDREESGRPRPRDLANEEEGEPEPRESLKENPRGAGHGIASGQMPTISAPRSTHPPEHAEAERRGISGGQEADQPTPFEAKGARTWTWLTNWLPASVSPRQLAGAAGILILAVGLFLFTQRRPADGDPPPPVPEQTVSREKQTDSPEKQTDSPDQQPEQPSPQASKSETEPSPERPKRPNDDGSRPTTGRTPSKTEVPPKVPVGKSDAMVRLESLRETARDHYQHSRPSQALSSAMAGLKIDSNDKDLRQLVSTLLDDARTAANRAKQDAIAAGAAVEAPTPFNQASGKVAEAAKLVDANRPDQAIEAYGAAKSAFAAATTQARQQLTSAKSEIVNVLKRFQSGYIQKDPHLIREAYPGADTDKIFRSLKNCSKLNLTFNEIRIDLLSNGQAQADVASVYGCQPKTGQGKQLSTTVSDTFRLARRDGSWVIVSWLIPLG